MELGQREVTVIVLPPARWRPLGLRLSLRALAWGLAAWTGLTLWAGVSAGRHIDYWATKAHNGALRGRVDRLQDAMARSHDDLRRVAEAERRLRRLLELDGKAAVLEEVERDDSLGEALPRDARQAVIGLEELDRRLAALKRRQLATPRGWPADGRQTSRFGYRFSPLANTGGADADEFHAGVDIANRSGTLIRATADGVVERAGWSGGYGRMVFIRHGEGYATLYGHASRLLVREGQAVRRGDPIAVMGSTGRSTGNHVHYEVWRHGRAIDPAPFL